MSVEILVHSLSQHELFSQFCLFSFDIFPYMYIILDIFLCILVYCQNDKLKSLT